MIKNNSFLLSIFFLTIIAANAYALECGALRLEKARSPGVDISGNTCGHPQNIAVESMLLLQPASRAWLESVADNGKASEFKIICQNESASPIKIKIASNALPWIKPESLLNCGAWVDKRLECKEPENNKVALICAIALRNKLVMTHEIQTSASINMRGTPGQGKVQPLTARQIQQLQSIMDNKVSKKIKLCKSLFAEELTINWTIDPSGRATNFSVTQSTSTQTTAKDPFADCVINHIKACPFPVFSSGIKVSSAFK
ncbi:MAG: hypothetical protein ABL933_05035 [Methyloglobulus sp.]|nr:hypothetical protein [Methyloglobulus sp.]